MASSAYQCYRLIRHAFVPAAAGITWAQAQDGTGLAWRAPAHTQLEAEDTVRKDELELRFVQIVFRHGARAPLTEKYGAHEHQWQYCSPAYEAVPIEVQGLGGGKVPLSDADKRQRSVQFKGGCHMGELTAIGQLQALHLGKWLRQQYVLEHQIIPDEYDPKAISVRSTNLSRTLATATGVLSGLYPDTDQAIAIQTAEDSQEWIYPNHRHCQRLQQLISKQYKKMKSVEEFGELEARLKKAIGLGSEDKLSWTALHDVCHSIMVHSNSFPGEMNEELMKELEAVAVEVMKRYVAPEDDSEHLSLSIGKVIQDLLFGMANAASGKQLQERMQLFSGHDTTLMPLLVTLGMPLKDKWPPFMSNIILELYWSKERSSHYVRALFNGSVIPLKDSNEDGFVEFATFYNALSKYNLIDFSAKCCTTKSVAQPKASGDSIGR